jgi:hypothetical protein
LAFSQLLAVLLQSVSLVVEPRPADSQYSAYCCAASAASSARCF